jgi:predicted RNase H-like HicB family nuclease
MNCCDFVIETLPDGTFRASLPWLPDLTADGPTPDQARQRMEQAIEAHLAARALSQPCEQLSHTGHAS